MLYMHWCHFNLSGLQAHHRTSRICSRYCLSIPLSSVICAWIRSKILSSILQSSQASNSTFTLLLQLDQSILLRMSPITVKYVVTSYIRIVIKQSHYCYVKGHLLLYSVQTTSLFYCIGNTSVTVHIANTVCVHHHHQCVYQHHS